MILNSSYEFEFYFGIFRRFFFSYTLLTINGIACAVTFDRLLTNYDEITADWNIIQPIK